HNSRVFKRKKVIEIQQDNSAIKKRIQEISFEKGADDVILLRPSGFKTHTNLLVPPFRFCPFVLDVVRRETLHLSGSMNLLDITIHSFLRLAASQGFVFPAR
ncbi:hypothetical protein ILYODFUR_018974, partial [Ilyodon furcidens]